MEKKKKKKPVFQFPGPVMEPAEGLTQLKLPWQIA